VGGIKIFEIFKVGVNFWDILLEELVHGVNLEEMFVFLEFASELSGSGFSKSCEAVYTKSFSIFNFISEESNGVKGVSGFLKLLDEELVGFASGNQELFEVLDDLSLSVIDPVEMLVGVFDFRFDPLSVFSSTFSLFLIGISSSLCVSDGLVSIDLVLFPVSIGLSLFISNRPGKLL